MGLRVHPDAQQILANSFKRYMFWGQSVTRHGSLITKPLTVVNLGEKRVKEPFTWGPARCARLGGHLASRGPVPVVRRALRGHPQTIAPQQIILRVWGASSRLYGVG